MSMKFNFYKRHSKDIPIERSHAAKKTYCISVKITDLKKQNNIARYRRDSGSTGHLSFFIDNSADSEQNIIITG